MKARIAIRYEYFGFGIDGVYTMIPFLMFAIATKLMRKCTLRYNKIRVTAKSSSFLLALNYVQKSGQIR